jgi:hypothetical protein
MTVGNVEKYLKLPECSVLSSFLSLTASFLCL